MAPKPKAGKEAAPFSIGMRSSFNEAPPFRPALNLGCTLDIPTGRYVRGGDGHFYHTGGLNQITGIVGRGNTFKSALAHAMLLIALSRFIPNCDAQARDTEFSQTYDRFQELACHLLSLAGIDLSEAEFFMISSQSENSGNAWFSQVCDFLEAKRNAGKSVTFTTPFLDNHQNPMKTLYPSIFELDSMSAFTADVATKILDENEVGEGGANTVFMRSAGAKAQMMMQLPGLMASSGGYFITTAHVDEEIKMETHAPDTRKLSYMPMGLKIKHVPNNFNTLTNNLWLVLKATVEQDGNKRPNFPRDERDKMDGDTDLMRLTIRNLRGKQGPTGLPTDLILSQKEGLLVPVTEFVYLKGRGGYGVTDHKNHAYALDLYPDVIFDRMTLRAMAYGDEKFQRAMTITSEMCQLKFLKPEHHDVLISPKKLYAAIKEKGFDWEKILDTRGHWVFKEMEADCKPFLSTLDLLTMAAGTEDHPWYALYR